MIHRNESKTKVGELSVIIIAILPIAFSWLFIASFVLIYVFDQLDYINNNQIIPGIDLLFFIIIMGIPVGISIIFMGIILDKFPQRIGHFTTIGLIGSSLSLFIDLIALALFNPIFVITAAALLGFFMGVLVVSSHVFYGSITKWSQRGRIYSLAILGFEICSILFILGTQILEMDFFLPFSIYAIFAMILGIMFYYFTHNWSFWTNDPWPTRLHQIISRSSVRVYFWTHTLVYLMIGIMIGSLAEAGTFLGIDIFFGVELGAYKVFWASLILGTGVSCIPAGYFVDKWGRKSAIIIATTGIVFASILVGLIQDPISFTLTAFLIGISFALIHPSLDSSIWVDLTSRDSIGRYFSLGFLSLSLGVVTGMIISNFNFFDSVSDMLIFNVFLLIALAVLASLPLFWTSDSFPPLYFFLLLVIDDAGMPIFHYDFGRASNLKVDLPLISGALCAVGSFMLEATGEKGARLNLVSHGTHFIISDKSDFGFSGTIFANKNDPELHKLLTKFLSKFQKKFGETLVSWKGDLSAFNDAKDDAEEIFGPLVTI